MVPSFILTTDDSFLLNCIQPLAVGSFLSVITLCLISWGARPRPPYHIILFCFVSAIRHVHKGGRDGETEREPERERGVPIKCKSITYRKQFSLAQVERKLEKSRADHALKHTPTNVHAQEHKRAQTHTWLDWPRCGWQEIGQSGSSWVLGGDCCVIGVSLPL